MSGTISITPYQSSAYFKSLVHPQNDEIAIDEKLVEYFSLIEKKSNPGEAPPLIVLDQCSMIYDQEYHLHIPIKSKWTRTKQIWNNNNNDFKYISNTPQRGGTFFWDQKHEYINTKNTIPSFNKFNDIIDDETKLIDINQIQQIYQANIKHIQANHAESCVHIFEDEQPSTLNSIVSKSVINTYTKSSPHTTIKCMEPGYIECIQRHPLDMWKIHIMMKGFRLLFVTDQLNKDQTAFFHEKFNHLESCPITALSSQQHLQYLPQLNSLVTWLKRYGKKLHVTLLRPGNISIISGTTFSFSLPVSDSNSWSKSIIFAPQHEDSLTKIQEAFASHQTFESHQTNNKIPVCSQCSSTTFHGDQIGVQLTASCEFMAKEEEHPVFEDIANTVHRNTHKDMLKDMNERDNRLELLQKNLAVRQV